MSEGSTQDGNDIQVIAKEYDELIKKGIEACKNFDLSRKEIENLFLFYDEKYNFRRLKEIFDKYKNVLDNEKLIIGACLQNQDKKELGKIVKVDNDNDKSYYITIETHGHGIHKGFRVDNPTNGFKNSSERKEEHWLKSLLLCRHHYKIRLEPRKLKDWEYRHEVIIEIDYSKRIDGKGKGICDSLFLILFFVIIVGIIVIWKLTHRTKERRYFSSEVNRQILKNQNYKCAICKRNTEVWDYDHKNGDRSNNKLSNCQVLCPNCHAKMTRDLLKNKVKSSQKLKFFIISLIIIVGFISFIDEEILLWLFFTFIWTICLNKEIHIS